MFKENFRILDGTVNMTLSCEVNNDVWVLLLKQFVNSLTVSDAFLNKTEIRVVHNRCQSRKITCIGKAVQTDDAVIRVFFLTCEK